MSLTSVSRIGRRRVTRELDGFVTEEYGPGTRPEPTLRGHLTFHLKHEVPHLELLARLFERCAPEELAAWIDSEPTGQFARRAG